MKSILTIQEIRKVLPHRYPFQLLDGVTELEDCKYAVGFKNFTINELFFQGHVPEEPVVPGVLIVEALAQLAGIMYSAKTVLSSSNAVGQMGYLGKICDLQFKQVVYPGDRLFLRVEAAEDYGSVHKVKVEATSEEGKCVAKGSLVVKR